MSKILSLARVIKKRRKTNKVTKVDKSVKFYENKSQCDYNPWLLSRVSD